MGQKNSVGRLSKQDVDFLKMNTHYDESTINEWYKGFISDCPDGKLSPTAFMNIYSKCFPVGNAKEFCDHVFRTFDSDNNGVIDFKEFLLAIDVTSKGTPAQKLQWAFSMYDVDGNGSIDLQEMTKIVKSIYRMMGPNQKLPQEDGMSDSAEQRAEIIFKKMDINADGKVTRQEFVKCCQHDQNLIGLLTPHTAAM